MSRSFPAEAGSVPAARKFAAGILTGAPSELLEAVELMVSELATNCIRHVNASFDLTIERHGDKVHVEVRDRAAGRPAMRSPAPADTQGRGLRIVDLLAARWGVRYDADAGKTVWFTLLAPPQDDAPDDERERSRERSLYGATAGESASSRQTQITNAA